MLRCGIALQRWVGVGPRRVGSVLGIVALARCWASWRCIAVWRMTALRWIGVGLATSFWRCIAASLVGSRRLIGMQHCIVTLRCVAVLCRGVVSRRCDTPSNSSSTSPFAFLCRFFGSGAHDAFSPQEASDLPSGQGYFSGFVKGLGRELGHAPCANKKQRQPFLGQGDYYSR